MASVSVILILGFIIVYFIMIETFSVLFRISGLTKEKSLFQTISLLTNAGFTTNESEVVVANRFRRRVAVSAMVTGNVFSVLIISLVLNLLLNVSYGEKEENFLIVTLIAFGVFLVIVVLLRLPFIKNPFDKAIEKIAIKMMKKTNAENTLTLLDNYGHGLSIYQIVINTVPAILVDTSLFKSRIKDLYNINILVLRRKSKVVEVTKDTMLQPNDIITVFGSSQNIKDVFKSKLKGDAKALLDVSGEENIIDLIDNYGEDAMVTIQIKKLPELLKDKPLFESGLKDKKHINVMIIKRNDNPIEIVKDTVVEVGDTITVFGPYKTIKDLFK